jgi:hypothetical protein
MRPRAGEWRARILLALISTAVCLALAEVAARMLLRPAPVPVEGTPISELSPTLGWRTRALGSQRIRRPDFDVSIALNSLGLRGPELPYEAAPGRKRMAIMGDSFAHGYYAQEPLTIRGRLAQALDSCGVDVLNAGSPGYSTDQEWLYFSSEIRKYRPTEVILLFYYNDLLANIEPVGTGNRSKPSFVEKDGELVLVPPQAQEPESIGTPAEAGGPQGAPVFKGSALWSFAATRLQRARPDWSRFLAEFGLAPELSRVPSAEFLPFGPLDGAERTRVAEMWKRTGLILGRFRDEVRESGGGFTVLYVPARFEVNDAAWTYLQRRYDPQRPWRRNAVTRRLAELLSASDIPLLEATEAFAAAEKSRDPAYLPIDGHWNARGNEIAFASVLPTMRRAFGCVS